MVVEEVAVRDQMLDAIIADPLAEDRWSVVADWLEENDDLRRAELLRLHRKLMATCCEPDRHPERAAWQARIVELIGDGVRPCVPQRTVVLGEGVEMTFNFIPPGTFLMGSPPDEEGRLDNEVLHRVTLPRVFWLGISPVTQGQWQAVMGSNSSRFQGDRRPGENVFWDDCVAFCRRLGEKFRLPTEAEWEYACRAGTMTAYYTGDGVEALKRAGWGSAEGTRPVGQFEPNAWGIFDMHGNVLEWVADWFGAYPNTDVK